MDIIHPDKPTFSLVKAFLEPYEEKCVLLASYVRRQSQKVYVLSETYQINSVNDILGVLYIDSSLFHCIPNTLALDSVELLRFLIRTVEKNGKKIKCISGERTGTDYFLNLLKVKDKKAFQVNNYRLMTAEGNINKNIKFPFLPLSKGERIIKCTEKEIDELFNLQKKYLQEEVAPKGKIVSRLEVAMSLRQILKNQLCLAVFSDGEIVAKANTNAIGINWIQLGGVYTHPSYRRNGYALHLVFSICRRAMKVNRGISLFVKENNVAAVHLYEKIGFHVKDSYKIAYF